MSKPWLKFYDAQVPEHLEYPEIPVYELLEKSAETFSDQPLARFFGKQFTYRQIKQASDRFAQSLREAGINPGDKIAFLLPNFPGYPIAYFGALKAGAVIVPLNPLYTVRELEFHFNHSGAETVVAIPMFLDKVKQLADKTSLKRIISARLGDFLPFPLNAVQTFRENKMVKRNLKDGRKSVYDFKKMTRGASVSSFEAHRPDPDEMAVLIYSGGTTGIAKGIMLSHRAIVTNAYQVQTWGHLKPDDRMLAILPFFHGYGMSVCMNTSILTGMEIIMLPKFDAKDMAKAVHKFKPTVTAVVPTILVALSNLKDIDKFDFSSLKAVWVGAAPLTKAIKENFEKKTGGRAIEGYGLTEAVTAIMANPYKGKHKIGSIGLPFSDVEAKIVSLDGNKDLSPGQPGEIALRTPTMMLGYYKDPEETAKTIKDGWLFTGDIGYADEDGYFYITDRKKELIITGGFNVFPREIDELIYDHPKVKEGITVGVPDAYKGERIKVFLVLRQGVRATADEFKKYFKEHLTPYKVPSEIEFRDDLPKSAIGKILRRVLREEEIKKQQEAKHE